MKSQNRILTTGAVIIFTFAVAWQSLASPVTNSANGQNTIDILFAYTTEAATEAGGLTALKVAYIDNGVRLLNEALTNSQTNAQIRVIPKLIEVSGVPVPQSQQDVSNILAALSKPDGDFSQVHQYRQQLKADILVLIFNGSVKMGKANLGQAPVDSNRNRACMVTHLATFGESYVFPHEFAHILGCNHQNEKGITPYAAGYNPGDGWRTIEANGGIAVPYFSANRTVTTANYGTIQIGNAANADCSRSIREVGAAFSLFGDNLPAINTSANRYVTSIKDANTLTVDTLPFDKSYTGTSTKATVVFSVTAGRNYWVTVEETGNSAPVAVKVKDMNGKQVLDITAFPREFESIKFNATTSGTYSLTTGNEFRSSAYRIQIKLE
ncbi:MAG: M12 family metallo-peptidase [Blastocatellia bacterium]